MSPNPYKNLPDHAFWRRAVAQLDPALVNPALTPPFTIAPADRVVTAGSCFAQHLGPLLQAIRFTHLVTEPAHPIFPAELARTFNYGVFSARYGNIYTPRQLLQLWRRAYGEFHPVDDIWPGPEHNFIDPFRPQIQPRGFLSRREFALDRAQHFAAVRAAFETMDVFVFTLSLTETWLSRVDGAVYPLCPGVAGGKFDPIQHEFHNLTVGEVVADMTAFIAAVRIKNPVCRVILTVTPVPLVATARADTHVMAATVYSKSVLRVAAEELAQSLAAVAYFPSYEIVTARYGGPSYYDADCRTVTGDGLAHVLRMFAASFANISVPPPPQANPTDTQARLRKMEKLMQVQCDQIALDPG